MDYTNTDSTMGNTAAPTEFSTSYFKELAKEHIRGKFGPYIGYSLVLGIVFCGISSIPIAGGIAVWVLSGVLAIGYVCIQMAIVEGRSPDSSDAFYGFMSLGNSITAGLLMSIYLFFWSFLIIPIFIKPYSYSATFYLLRKYPTMGGNEAITKSRQIMNGHKMEAFILGLSFFGWILLCIFSCGLACLYVGPYMGTTFAEFYNRLIEDDASKN